MADIEIKRVPRIDVKKAGTLVGTRPAINLIEGSNVTLTVADDSAGNEVDVTIAASAGSATPSDFQPAIVTNNYYLSPYATPTSSTDDTIDADVLRAFPIHFSHTVTWTRIGLYIATPSGSAVEKVRLGIYSSGADNLPSALVVDSGELGLNSSGEVEATISASLQANTLYWIASLTNDPGTTTVVSKTASGGSSQAYAQDRTIFMTGTPTFTYGISAYVSASQAYGALPATFPTPARDGSSLPLIWLRKV